MGSSFNALFCTAQIPASKINELLQLADKDETTGNIFCLIETPSQKRVDKPTNPPFSDFETGFLGWSNEQLGDWCNEKFNWYTSKTQPPYIEERTFAVLDERFLQDGTVMLVKSDAWHERIDPNHPSDADEAFRDCEGYRTVRVTKKAAASTMAGLLYLSLDDLYDSMKSEDNGVMSMQ